MSPPHWPPACGPSPRTLSSGRPRMRGRRIGVRQSPHSLRVASEALLRPEPRFFCTHANSSSVASAMRLISRSTQRAWRGRGGIVFAACVEWSGAGVGADEWLGQGDGCGAVRTVRAAWGCASPYCRRIGSGTPPDTGGRESGHRSPAAESCSLNKFLRKRGKLKNQNAYYTSREIRHRGQQLRGRPIKIELAFHLEFFACGQPTKKFIHEQDK